MKSDHLRLTSGKIALMVLVASWLVTLVLMFLVPVYTDEINWQMIKARLFVDDFSTTRISPPNCTTGSAAPWVWFMVPFRMLDSFLYLGLNNPIEFRIIGICTFVIWLILLFILSKRYLAPQFTATATAICILSFLSLGVLPFLLVLDRPEQGLLLILTILSFLPLLLVRSQEQSHIGAASSALALIFLALCLLTTHPKGAFFLPIIAVCGWYLIGRWPVRLFAYAAILFFAWGSANEWTSRLVCPNDAEVREDLYSHSLSLALLSGPGKAIELFFASAKHKFGIFGYIWSMSFQSSYMSAWLPPNSRFGLLDQIVNIGIFLIFVMLFAIFVTAMIGLVRSSWKSGILSRQVVVIFSLLLSLSGLAVIQFTKHPYESTLVVPLYGLILLIAIKGRGGTRFQQHFNTLATILFVVSLASQFNLWRLFGGTALSSWAQGGYLADQGYSISSFGYSRVRTDIITTAKLCDIDLDHPLRHLVVDELTYPVFSGTFQPMLLLYVNSDWGRGISDLTKFLTERHSSGVIAGCRFFPADLRGVVQQHGDFCCAPVFAR